MCLLLFAAPSDKTGKAIMEAIKVQLPDETVEICTTVDSLALELSEHRNEKELAILVPTGEEELIDIYSMKEMFNRVPIVIVLPNRDSFVEAMGWRLKPRLMCHREGNVAEAVSKLRNTVRSSHAENMVVYPSFGNDSLAGHNKQGSR